MLYRIARWKMESRDIQSFKQGLVSLFRRRTFTKRPAKVDIPVPIVDQNEAAFRHFTEIPSIDRKKKNKFRYYLKNQKSNTFLAWLNMSANDSCATVVSGHNSTGVSASTEYTTQSKLLLVDTENASKICQQMKILETAEDLELCTSSPSNSFRPMSEMIDLEHNPITDDCDSKMTKPPRNVLIEKVDSIDLIVAMFDGLSLDDKRKIKESDREHFETFQSHRPYARPYGKRIKMFNN